MDKKAYSVDEFLRAYGLSRATLYRLWNRGRGPRKLMVGKKVLITVVAADDWIKSLIAEQSND